uniref:Uncharacterized protein n=1 Tax=Schistocephalus solidus TaxID=70667 RepID=A0A0X3NRW0_SCHSO
MKQIKNVNVDYGYERCNVVGVYKDKVVYLEDGCKEGKDEDFNEAVDDEHRVGVSPFTVCNLGLISYFPLDPLHLVYLGVMKKLISLWLRNRRSKTSASINTHVLFFSVVDEVSPRLLSLNAYLPAEFSKIGMNLNEFDCWKGT